MPTDLKNDGRAVDAENIVPGKGLEVVLQAVISAFAVRIVFIGGPDSLQDGLGIRVVAVKPAPGAEPARLPYAPLTVFPPRVAIQIDVGLLVNEIAAFIRPGEAEKRRHGIKMKTVLCGEPVRPCEQRVRGSGVFLALRSPSFDAALA